MMTNELLDPFVRLLADVCDPATVRAVEAGGSPAALWDALHQSGFLDALVPEAAGGAGLSLGDIQPLIEALGRFAVPVAVAETMVARALLARAGLTPPEGAIVLAQSAAGPAAGPALAGFVPLAMTAGYALVDQGDRLALYDLAHVTRTPSGVHGSLGAFLSCGQAEPIATLAAPVDGLRPIAAVLRAADMAGAADKLLHMTADWANERVQFGKPIGRQQAIQQNMAVMAELAVSMRIASQIGCTTGLPPQLETAALAKQITSSAASQISNIAHAVHGAIGISEEFDLQLYVRRLREWRLADGSEQYWATVLGQRRLAHAAENSVDFIRRCCA